MVRVSSHFQAAVISMRMRLLFLAFLWCGAASRVSGATIYVDRQIAPASCTNYAPASRSCGSGAGRAYKTVAGAAGVAVAGDTVFVRGGSYSEPLSPAASGTAALPITFSAYPAETPILTGVADVAITLIGRSYVVIDGLTVTSVGGLGRIENGTGNIVRNCTFSLATISGTTGGWKLVRATFNQILNNTLDDANDSITIQESDRNVVEGNTVTKARHSLLSLRCGNFNVVRGNTFSNPDQKDLEIYDCEGTSDAPVKLDATKRNLIEDNVIADTKATSSDHDYNGIQFGGQQGIVRRNVFRDNQGGGMNFQYYSQESLYNNRNRVYHNTFYGNRCYGVVGESGSASQFFDNRVRNSLFYKNTSCAGGGTAQTLIADAGQVILSNNALATTSPGFVGEAVRDLHLAPGSAMIDAGAFLTTATSAGTGTSLPVADAGYFYDGFQVPGQVGDLIQLQGQTGVARILAIDYNTNTLTLDTALTRTAGQGVALAYVGAAPDQGAFEFVPPPPPAVAVRFYTVPPCRRFDTRVNASGGPALRASSTRAFAITGACNIPTTAKAISSNLTVTQGTTQGFLSIYPTGAPLPSSSTINFSAAQTRANSVILALGHGGAVTLRSGQPTGTTHVILDVNGYYQ